MSRPTPEEYYTYYKAFIDLVPDGDLTEILASTIEDTRKLLSNLEDDLGDYAYAPKKWTLKEVIMHLTDTEQIFLTRALRIARKDQTPNPSFDQNLYVEEVDLSSRSLNSLLDEFQAMRQLTLARFRHFDADTLQLTGLASGHVTSIRAIGYIIAGHEIHHRNVIRERYLEQSS